MTPPWFYFILTPLSALKRLLQALWLWVARDKARVAIVVLAALYAFLCWRLAAIDGDRDRLRDTVAEYEAASAKIEAADKVADEKGLATAVQTKKDIDDGNERARQAAAGSDDPLGAAFGELRKANPPKGD